MLWNVIYMYRCCWSIHIKFEFSHLMNTVLYEYIKFFLWTYKSLIPHCCSTGFTGYERLICEQTYYPKSLWALHVNCDFVHWQMVLHSTSFQYEYIIGYIAPNILGREYIIIPLSHRETIFSSSQYQGEFCGPSFIGVLRVELLADTGLMG